MPKSSDVDAEVARVLANPHSTEREVLNCIVLVADKARRAIKKLEQLRKAEHRKPRIRRPKPAVVAEIKRVA